MRDSSSMMPMPSDAKPNLTPKLRFPELRDSPGWKEKPLREAVALVVRERQKPNAPYTGLGLRSHGKNTFIKDNEDPKKNTMDCLYEVKRDDLIVNITFAWEGAIAIAKPGDEGALVSHRFPTYTFERGVAIPEFFQHIISSKNFVYDLGVISPGGAGRNRVLNKNEFLKLTTFLPEVDEQQTIAECLSTLDKLIGAESQKLDALKAHKKGLMQQLFPHAGETLPRLRFPEFQNAPEWEEKAVGDFGEVVTGSTPSTVRFEFYGGGIPFVSPADISDLRFVDETKTTLTALGFDETRPIRANSVLFVCIGSTIGKVAQNWRECATNQQIHSVVPNAEHSEAFVYYALVNDADRIAELAGIQAVPIINKALFSSVTLPVPKLPEQQRIASCLSSLDDLIAAQSDKLEALKTHKRGLMQQLFPSPPEAES